MQVGNGSLVAYCDLVAATALARARKMLKLADATATAWFTLSYDFAGGKLSFSCGADAITYSLVVATFRFALIALTVPIHTSSYSDNPFHARIFL